MGFSAAVAIVGVGVSAYGTSQSISASKASAAANQDMIQQQQAQAALQKQAMEVDARRKTLQQVRQAQVARSTALSAATNQGAGAGSGLQGGYGQISGSSNTNLLGISQGLQTGEANFGLNSNISQDRINLANAQSQGAIGGALTSLGGALISNSGTIGNLSKGFGGGGGADIGIFNNGGGYSPTWSQGSTSKPWG